MFFARIVGVKAVFRNKSGGIKGCAALKGLLISEFLNLETQRF